MPSNQRQVIKRAKFAYSPLEKAFEKQTKTIEEQGRKQIDAIINQNERLAALANENDQKMITEIFIKKYLIIILFYLNIVLKVILLEKDLTIIMMV